MSNIPSANQKIQVEPTQYRAPVSESLLQTIGGSVNYALDTVATNTSAIGAETAARIAADNTINGKSTFRLTLNTSGGIDFDSNFVFSPGALMEEQFFNISHADTAETWMLVQIRAHAFNTAGRQESSVQMQLVSDDSYGTQNVHTFTDVSGEHFGTTICLLNYSNPLQIKFRQFAGGLSTSQKWSWEIRMRFCIFNNNTLIGS
jgi:hypothetical protein